MKSSSSAENPVWKTAEFAWRAFALAWVALSLAVPCVLLASTFLERTDDGLSIDVSAWDHVFGGGVETRDSQEKTNLWTRLAPNTLTAVAVAVVSVLGLATPLAWLFFRTRIAGRGLALGLLLLVALLPFYVVTSAVIDAFGLMNLRHSASAIGGIHALAYLPIGVLLLGAAFRSIPRELEEVAELEAISTTRRAWLAVRTAVPTLVALSMLVTLWISSDYTASNLLLVTTYAETVLEQFVLHGRPEEATLVSLPLIILFAPLFWMLAKPCASRLGTGRVNAKRFELGAARWPTSLALIAFGLLLSGIPIAFVVANIHSAKSFISTLRTFPQELFTSLWTSVSAGLICAFCGNYLAWKLVRKKRARLLGAWVIVALVLPPPLVGIGLIEIFNHDGPLGWIYDSPTIYVVAYVIRFLPIMTILSLPAIRAVPRALEEAAEMEGFSESRTWLRVTVPICARSLSIAFLVSMILSVGELPASNLVMPPGYSTVGPIFYGMIHYSLAGQAAVLASISIGMILIAWGSIMLLGKRRLFS